MIAELQLLLGESLISRGDYRRAADELAQSIQRLRGLDTIPRLPLGRALHHHGVALHYAARYQEAETSLEQAIGLMSWDAMSQLPTRTALASVLHSRGRYAAAEREAVTAWEAVDTAAPAFAVQDAGTTLALGSETGHRRCAGGNCPGIFGTRGITEGAAASLIGGAIYAQGGAAVTAWQTQLFDNFANNGSAIHASGSTTRVELHHFLVASNFLYGIGNGTSTIEATGSADLTLNHVTMAQNFRFSGQFPFFERAASSIRANGNNSVVALRNTLLWDDAQLLIRLLVGASVEAVCVFGHEEISVFGVHAANPQYINPALTNPDYGLQDGSLAIDYCFNPPGSRPRDLLGTRRAVDWPDVPMFFGEHDAGAIEMRIPGDAIFADWFEFED